MASDSENVAIKGMDKLYEFEREPVSEDKLQPAKHFAGIFAGGDIATGAATVISAMGAGKRAARAIDDYVMGRKKVKAKI